MGAVKSGDIRQFTWYGREFDIKAGDANVNVDLGGFANEAGINGNGSFNVTQRRKVAGFSDLPIMIDDSRQDLEFLQGKASAGEPGPCTMTLASNTTYSGALLPIGDILKATGDGVYTAEGRGAKFEQI